MVFRPQGGISTDRFLAALLCQHHGPAIRDKALHGRPWLRYERNRRAQWHHWHIGGHARELPSQHADKAMGNGKGENSFCGVHTVSNHLFRVHVDGYPLQDGVGGWHRVSLDLLWHGYGGGVHLFDVHRAQGRRRDRLHHTDCHHTYQWVAHGYR